MWWCLACQECQQLLATEVPPTPGPIEHLAGPPLIACLHTHLATPPHTLHCVWNWELLNTKAILSAPPTIFHLCFPPYSPPPPFLSFPSSHHTHHILEWERKYYTSYLLLLLIIISLLNLFLSYFLSSVHTFEILLSNGILTTQWHELAAYLWLILDIQYGIITT